MFKSKYRFAKVSLVLLVIALMLMVPLSTVFAASSTGPGQPNQSCEDPGSLTPGNSASGPGSAFNPDGVSGTMYAGEQAQNSVNPHSVSQYDVACFQVTQH